MVLMELVRRAFKAMSHVVLVVGVASHPASLIFEYAAYELTSEDFGDLPLRFSVNYDWLRRILDLAWHGFGRMAS